MIGVQAHVSVMAGTEEFVLETLISFDKVACMLDE